jgi:GH35 family endo-1,4-beta-xylanase
MLVVTVLPTTALPTATATPPNTPTPTPTPTVTPTTIPTIQIGDLVVPDPHFTNPELFDVSKPDAPIPQFVNAMEMAGFELMAEEVQAQLQYLELKAKDGHSVIMITCRIPEEAIGSKEWSGDYPLVLAEQEEGVWQWRSSGIDALGQMLGIPFGVSLWYKDNTGSIISDGRYDRIVRNDFSLGSIGAGVAWKWLERTPGQLDSWSLSDISGQLQQVGAYKNLERLRLHALVWPEHYPDWLGNLSPDEMTASMTEHIEYLASRYRGAVQEVVVVNEPYYKGPLFSGSGSFTRPDVLYEELGKDYLVTAFATARESFGPGVELIYNDTANHSPIYGPNGCYTQITQKNVALLAQQGLVDFVGMQMHIDAAHPPSADEVIAAVKEYSVPVVITELDVRLDSLPKGTSDTEKQKIQARLYARAIGAAVESGQVKEISIGEAGDKYSWFGQWMNSPDAHATPFDDQFHPKIAYYAMLKELFRQIGLIQVQ